MYELKVLSSFSAAHQLSIQNKKCENLHGHNWKVEAYVTGFNLDNTGVLLDFSIIKKNLNSIIKKLDHSFLNDLDNFSNGATPSSESIARYIFDQLESKIKNSRVLVSKVSVWESENACATYYSSQDTFKNSHKL